MLASDVIAICETDGLNALAHMFGLTIRQARAYEVQARRAVNDGRNPALSPGDTLGRSRAVQAATEEPASDPVSLEEQAQARARAIASQSWGQRSYDIAALRGRAKTLRRNVEKGYVSDWEYDLALTTRILELLEGTA